MYDAYEFYKDCEYQIPRLLIINNFIKNNHVNINNIADVMKNVKNLFGLQSHISILKYEIEELKHTKNKLQYSQDNYTLETLSEINRNYPKYHI
jgi:transposase-like protein